MGDRMNGIMQSTTPTVRFTFKVINVPDIIEAYLTIKQEGKLIAERDLNEATIEDKALAWVLTQEETLKINPQRTIDVQCKYKLIQGQVYASKKYEVLGFEILKKDVI